MSCYFLSRFVEVKVAERCRDRVMLEVANLMIVFNDGEVYIIRYQEDMQWFFNLAPAQSPPRASVAKAVATGQ